MNEASKARERLKREGLFDRWIVPPVLDIGAGSDPVVPEARVWDLADGDAQGLSGLADESFSTVFSSHCLEHMRDPTEALRNWWRVLRPGGHLVLLVPDECLYEQGIWPSAFNPDHKWTFGVSSDPSWSPRHLDLAALVATLPNREVLSMRRVDAGYDYAQLGGLADQTLGPAEAAIEAVVRKLDRLLPLRSTLARLIPCPSCHRLQLTLLGVDRNNRLTVLCDHCGTTGTI